MKSSPAFMSGGFFLNFATCASRDRRQAEVCAGNACQTRPPGSNKTGLPIANLSPSPLKIGRLHNALFCISHMLLILEMGEKYMTMKEKVTVSKFLSLVLRHRPEKIGITLDQNGWADTDALISGLKQAGRRVTLQDLMDIVDTNEKQRFKFNDDYSKIRANQGHSISVDLELKETTPPVILYHGTASCFIKAIKKEGLKPKGRQHVHLSSDTETAVNVGSRHGKAVVLTINSLKMHEDGYKFYLSENSVWLTSAVPAEYISQFQL